MTFSIGTDYNEVLDDCVKTSFCILSYPAKKSLWTGVWIFFRFFVRIS